MTTRAEHLTALEELQTAVFGDQPGDEPNVYALGYDELTALSRRLREAIEYLSGSSKLHIIFKSQDDPNGGPQQQVFVGIWDENGNEANAGEWTANGEYEQLIMDTVSQPNLGAATTRQLIAELAARAETGGYANYRTVDSETDNDDAFICSCGCNKIDD